MDAPLVEKYAGPIATLLVALFGGISTWVARISGRVSRVEGRASSSEVKINHIQNDVAKLEDTVRRNHAENMRMHERVFDRVDDLARRERK